MTNEGYALAEKLETVTGDSLSPVTSGTVPFAVNSIQSPSSSHSVDLTCELKFSTSTAKVPCRNSEPVQHVYIDVNEAEDLDMKSASLHGFTSVRRKEEKEIKPRCVEVC